MKTLLLTLIFCLFNLTTSEIIGKYQIESERSFDTLDLKKDGTYEYQSRGDNCYTWFEFSGTWELKKDKLTLHRNYTFDEESTEYVEKTDSISKSFMTFKVRDKLGNTISDFEIKYWCENENERIKKTDQFGIAKFDKCKDINSQNKTVGIGIKYLTNGNETTSTFSVYKETDQIILSINDEPKTITEKVEYEFSYDNGIITSIEFPHVTKKSTYKKL
uniref:hypothetical protein n=1 Tax=Gelidibacter sp. TaxID=2018083 RepID=UPI00404A94F9